MSRDDTEYYKRQDYYANNPDDRCETCGGEHSESDCPFLDDDDD